MVDAPGAAPGSREPLVPEIKPLDQYDFSRAKICASVRWLLSKCYGSAGTREEEVVEGEEEAFGVGRVVISHQL